MKNLFLTFILISSSIVFYAQSDSSSILKTKQAKIFNSNWDGLKLKLNESGSRYFQFTVMNQVWLRFNESNPGSMVANELQSSTFDIGIRRLRLQMIGQVHEKFYIYVQFGINNFNNLSPRKLGDFFHDAIVEYEPWRGKLGNVSIGTGLTGWTGLVRYSAPSVGTFLMSDAPIYQQSTNDATDQFLRKLSLYVKGQIGHFDYRLVLSDPFLYANSPQYTPTSPISQYSQFNPNTSTLQTSGYFKYQFFDIESNKSAYAVGTYLGAKKVLNLGAGFEFQPNCMWNTTALGDTVRNPMWSVGADIFYDSYLGKQKDLAITAYGAYTYYNFGPGYLRNVGVMNPSTQLSPGTPTVNGPGSAFPMIGTGHTGYAQVGFMMPKHWFGKNSEFTIQPYVGTQVSKWDRLQDPMVMFDSGINFMFQGHRYKVSLNYQNRPVFDNTNFRQSERKSMAYIFFQIAI